MEIRVMSKSSNSRVYHRPECRYAKKIYKRNRRKTDRETAEWQGRRPCRCCNGTAFLFEQEKEAIRRFQEEHGLDVDLWNNEIYVRTDVGCWKIHYKTHEQKFILFHRNYAKGRTLLEDVEKIPYHRQKDVYEAKSILSYLEYIQKHDWFKKYGPTDYRQMPQKTKQQRYYYHTAKRRQERRTARRLDALFLMIEQKEGIKQLSVC